MNHFTISMLKSDNVKKLLWNTQPISIESISLLYLSAAISPYSGKYFKVKNKDQSVVKHIVLNSLKLSVAQSEFCDRLLVNARKISDTVARHEEYSMDRKSLGLFVREIGSRPLGSQWDLAILIAYLLDVSKLEQGLDCEEACLILEKYEELMKSIFSARLQNAYDIKPILDGKSVARILNMKPGPQIGHILQQLLEWQLSKNDPTEEQATNYLKSHFLAK